MTLSKAITMFFQTDSILKNIPHIQFECEEYYVELTMFCEIFLTFSLNVEISYKILLVPRYNVMALNNVMISIEDFEHYSIGK